VGGPIAAGHEDRYKFKLIDTGGGHYYLWHKHSDKYVCTASRDNGGEIHLWGPIPQGHEKRYRFRFAVAGVTPAHNYDVTPIKNPEKRTDD